MSTDSLDTFVDTLRQLHLLSSQQLSEFATMLEKDAADPEALGRMLIERRWLTPYQVEQLRKQNKADLALGPYLLLEYLGEGGMGRVYKALHRHLERTTALKVIRPDRLSAAHVKERFYREAKTAASLQHPNIVSIFDADQDQGIHFLAMEYVEGVNLRHLVRTVGPLPAPRACEYARQTALGLQHACEQGLVHRDIKPSNLMATGGVAGDFPHLKILDFGLARWTSELRGDDDITGSGQFVGTPDFVAPEQASDGRAADIRADIFSLGCTLYFLLTGVSPCSGSTVAQKLAARLYGFDTDRLPPGIPAELHAVLRNMLAVDPRHRFQTPREVAEALQPFTRTGGPTSGGPTNRAEPATPQGEQGVTRSARSASGTARQATDHESERTPMWVPPVSNKPLPPAELGEAAAPIAPTRMPARRRTVAYALLGLLVVAVAASVAAWQFEWFPGRNHNPPTPNGIPGQLSSDRTGIANMIVPSGQITNSIGMKLVLIPAGSFKMGSTEDEAGPDNEMPLHDVRIQRPFFMGKFEVTQAEYEQVMNTNPSHFGPAGKGKDRVPHGKHGDLPVDSVSWNDAVEFCRRLTASAQEKKHGRVYRLPTEAEWEYACRAGTSTPFHSGMSVVGNVAGTVATTLPGGQYKANAFGLCDMHGNVREWCQDTEARYPAEPQVDPKGAANEGDKVLRGGAFGFAPFENRSARRISFQPNHREKYNGFRIVWERATMP